MEPINISWGAALLMEQQDMALAHHSASPSSLTGKPQPSAELAAAWPFLEGRGPRTQGQKDALRPGSLGAAGTSHWLGDSCGWQGCDMGCIGPGDVGGDGGKKVESISTQRMFAKQTVRLPVSASEDFRLT